MTLKTRCFYQTLLTDTELSNHADIRTRAQSLHESLGTRLGDRTQVVNQVGLGHSDTGITDGQGLVLLVRGDSDVEVLLGVELGWVGEGGVTDFVKSIGRVGLLESMGCSRVRLVIIGKEGKVENRSTHNQFTQEDFLVGVEGVDDKIEQLGDLGLEAVLR